MAYIGRYAPSPTGRLHLGNLRTALISWLHCRLNHGDFIIRIDDLDTPRNVAGAQQQMLADLDWLGLKWDRVETQSQRLDIYAHYFEQLKNQNRLFACRCSRKDIIEALSAPHKKGLIYPGFCRNKNYTDQELNDAAWRFRVDDIDLCFDDELYGLQCVNLAADIGDFVVKRRDHFYAYQFACAIDDMTMGITDIVRGSDLLDSSFRQLAIIKALTNKLPNYCHIQLMLDDQGQRLSKRDGSASLKQLKHFQADEIIAYLAVSIGLLNKDFRAISADELLNLLDYPSFIKALGKKGT